MTYLRNRTDLPKFLSIVAQFLLDLQKHLQHLANDDWPEARDMEGAHSYKNYSETHKHLGLDARYVQS